MEQPREAETHRLVGEVLCLDFANTLNGHRRRSGHEYLYDYRDLILWSRHAGILSEKEARVLLDEAAARSTEAASIFHAGLELREIIFRIFSALAAGKEADPGDLERITAAWRVGQMHTRLVQTSTGFDLDWDDEPSLEGPLRTVSASAISLLTSIEKMHIRMCAGDICDWLFIDTSRNHLRRWCSMDECGNRAKMQRRQGRQRLALAR